MSVNLKPNDKILWKNLAENLFRYETNLEYTPTVYQLFELKI